LSICTACAAQRTPAKLDLRITIRTSGTMLCFGFRFLDFSCWSYRVSVLIASGETTAGDRLTLVSSGIGLSGS
jgi:hypothetical protein